MNVIIIGCGRVGALTAERLDRQGHRVCVVDSNQRAFERLPASFQGDTVRGSGTDEDVLRQACGGQPVDLLMALSEGDNRNVLAAQLGKHSFGIPRVIAKINDPLRAEAYRRLGLETMCRTIIMADALELAALEGPEETSGSVEPPTAEPLRGAPVAGSPADVQAREAIEETAADTGDPGAPDAPGSTAAAAS